MPTIPSWPFIFIFKTTVQGGWEVAQHNMELRMRELDETSGLGTATRASHLPPVSWSARLPRPSCILNSCSQVC